jgi:hypothetical protein
LDQLLDNDSFKATCRGSGTAIYNPANKSWLVFSYHLSFPTPNDIAKKICLEIAAFEKAADGKLKSEIADKNADELLAQLLQEEKDKKKGKKKGKNGK